MIRNKLSRLTVLPLGILITNFAASVRAQVIPPAPSSRVIDHVETIHGIQVSDPYQWLEQSTAPQTRDWINAEQSYTKSLLTERAGTGALRNELHSISNMEETQLALFRAGRYFSLRRNAGAEKASIYVRDGLNGAEKKLVDASIAGSASASTIELLNVSSDGRLLAYGVRAGGRDQLSIHFFDTRTMHVLPDVLSEARYIYWSLPISPDNSRVYYVKFDDDGPRVYAHQFGAPVSSDTVIFGQGLDADMILQVGLSSDGSLLLFHALHGAAGPVDVYVKEVTTSSDARSVIRGAPATFHAEAAAGKIFIETNWKAPKGHIIVADALHPDPEHWTEIVAEEASTIEGFHLARGHLLVEYLKNAHSELRIFSAKGKGEGTIALPGIGTVAAVEAEWTSPVVCYSYSSFQRPPSTYSYSLARKNSAALSVPPQPAGLSDVVVDQVWYASKDGTKIPMFLAHRSKVVLDGSNPVLLYGYGGFNWSQTPTFSLEVADWLKHGGVYAVANIRGGSEFGEGWHAAGEGALKQNCFDDFNAAAEWLIGQHYTQPGKLAIQGLSNGGLLVTASITQRPDLFAAAIGRYPLIDMVRYERFSIARWWSSEYGSASDAEQFKTLYAYSPYHHVKTGEKYPAVLLITGDGDTRVDPSHARKMTAMLQSATSSDRPVLLLYDSTSGHSGSLSAAAEIEQTANEIEFLLWQLNVR